MSLVRVDGMTTRRRLWVTVAGSSVVLILGLGFAYFYACMRAHAALRSCLKGGGEQKITSIEIAGHWRTVRCEDPVILDALGRAMSESEVEYTLQGACISYEALFRFAPVCTCRVGIDVGTEEEKIVFLVDRSLASSFQGLDPDYFTIDLSDVNEGWVADLFGKLRAPDLRGVVELERSPR